MRLGVLRRLFPFSVFLSLPFILAPSYSNIQISRITRVHDGDTFIVDVDHYPDILGKSIGVRVSGVDCPEIRDRRPNYRERAEQAKKFTETFLSGKTIELRKVRRDKYFRINAEVWGTGKVGEVERESLSLGEELVKSGLAIRYNGKGKKYELD